MSEDARANVCDYQGCLAPIAPSQENTTSMRFCETHLAECMKLIADMNSKGIVAFWIKASGGLHKMAHTPAGVYQSHELARSGFVQNPPEVSGK
jgi:hypothetical protein